MLFRNLLPLFYHDGKMAIDVPMALLCILAQWHWAQWQNSNSCANDTIEHISTITLSKKDNGKIATYVPMALICYYDNAT